MEIILPVMVTLYGFLSLVASLRAQAAEPTHWAFHLNSIVGMGVLFFGISYILWLTPTFGGVDWWVKGLLEIALISFPAAVFFYFK